MPFNADRLHTAFNALEAADQEIQAALVDGGMAALRLRKGVSSRRTALDAYRSAVMDVLTLLLSTVHDQNERIDHCERLIADMKRHGPMDE